ncbi:MAG: NAD(P)H-hydrate dehydratase [Candidatus Hodarchaeota archaeon]
MQNSPFLSLFKKYEDKEITPKQMAVIDENCSYLGISTKLLMENAGKAVSQEIIKEKQDISNKTIFIFAGTGNNGGDAFVVARHLSYFYPKINVLLLGHSSQIRTEISKKNWNALEKMQYSTSRFEIINPNQLYSLKEEILSADILIDGLLGTGIKGKLREPVSTAIDLINESKGFKVAIDIPSGLDPLNGKIQDKAVKADLTITFHKLKIGLKNNENYVGKLVISEIGIPPEAEFLVGTGDVKFLQSSRDPHGHKGDFGKILVIGGGQYYTGAPALVGLAAYRTGADLVIVATPEKVALNLRSYSPNLIVRDLPGDVLSEKALPALEKLLPWATSVAIGPGLGTENTTLKTVLEIVQKVQKNRIPLVIDADALKAIALDLKVLSNSNVVLTPHEGEFKKLTGIDLKDLALSIKIQKVIESARGMGVTILLKGHEDIISNGKKFKINLTGCPAMTVGGTGDVLTGIVSCLIGQQFNIFESAVSAAFINGKAGELASKKYFGNHIMATDLLELIPEAMKV